MRPSKPRRSEAGPDGLGGFLSAATRSVFSHENVDSVRAKVTVSRRFVDRTKQVQLTDQRPDWQSKCADQLLQRKVVGDFATRAEGGDVDADRSRATPIA